MKGKTKTWAAWVLSVCLVVALLYALVMTLRSSPARQLSVRLSRQLLSVKNIAQLTTNLGVELARIGHWQAARVVFEQCASMGTVEPSLLNNLAYVEIHLGEFEKAEQHLNQALTQSPDCHECLNNLGSLFVELKRVSEAKDMFEKALMLMPDYAEAAINLAVLYETNGQFADAYEWYEKAGKTVQDPAVKELILLRVGLFKDMSDYIQRNISGVP